MVHDVVTGLHEFQNKEQALTENQTIISEPVNYVAKAVQITQQQLATQL